jgi:hypothetical protein
MLKELKHGMAVRHPKSDDVYNVVSMDVKAKHPDSGEWFVSVLYLNREGQMYVREMVNFMESFDALEPSMAIGCGCAVCDPQQALKETLN